VGLMRAKALAEAHEQFTLTPLLIGGWAGWAGWAGFCGQPCTCYSGPVSPRMLVLPALFSHAHWLRCFCWPLLARCFHASRTICPIPPPAPRSRLPALPLLAALLLHRLGDAGERAQGQRQPHTALVREKRGRGWAWVGSCWGLKFGQRWLAWPAGSGQGWLGWRAAGGELQQAHRFIRFELHAPSPGTPGSPAPILNCWSVDMATLTPSPHALPSCLHLACAMCRWIHHHYWSIGTSMLMLSLPVDSPSVARSVQTFLWWAILQGGVIVAQNRCGHGGCGRG